MKKSNVITSILIVLLVIVSMAFINLKLQNHRTQKTIDEMFTNSYNNLTLNMLNKNVEGIDEDAIHRYNVENTKWSSILTNYYPLTSFYKYKNTDLNYIIAMLAQSSGYNAVTELDMNIELYRKIKKVPENYFRDEEILREAKTAIENAEIEK